MFEGLFNFWRKPKVPTIRAQNITQKYLANAEYLSRVSGLKFVPNKKVVSPKPHKLYVLNFNGDLWASRSEAFGEEISSILSFADPQRDEVLIKVNSAGGAAHAYGYAASQIDRLKKAKIKVTVAVDKVAASGGYMMACVADHILAAPFAVIGSIGVVSEFPNFSELLKDLGVEYKQYTAGKFKRTVSQFAEINEEGEKEFINDLELMHEQFKDHVALYRKDLDIDAVANGKSWTGNRAKDVGLVDEIRTSDDFILSNIGFRDIISVQYVGDSSGFAKMFGRGFADAAADVFTKVFSKLYMNFMAIR